MKINIKKILIAYTLFPSLAFAQSTSVTDTIVDQIDCASITYNLKLGSRDANTGGDVTTLQIYLSQANYLDSDPTGYLGKVTKKALQDFQRANGISPTGTVGPLTRAKIKEISCKASSVSTQPVVSVKSPVDQPITTPTQTSVVTGKLSVSPSTGTSPLVVTLQAPQEVMNKMQKCVFSRGWFGASGNGLHVDWGDGSYAPDLSYGEDILLGKSCTPFVMKHTYYRGGTYTIKVKSWHPGPTDAPVIDWEGSTVLQVAKNFSATSSTENLIIPSETAKLDLKVNSSDGPVTLDGSQNVKIEWKSSNMYDCSIDIAGVSTTPIPASGSQITSVNPIWTSVIALNCKTNRTSEVLTDNVRILSTSKTTGYENVQGAQ